MSAWWDIIPPEPDDGSGGDQPDRFSRLSFCPYCCTGEPPPSPCECTLWADNTGPCCYEVRFSGFSGDQEVWNSRAFHVQFVSESSTYGLTGCAMLGTICNPATNLRHLLRVFIRLANVGEEGPYVIEVRIGGLKASPWSDATGGTTPEYRWTRQLAEKPSISTSFIGEFARTLGDEGVVESVIPASDCTTEEWCSSCACYRDLPQYMLIEIEGVTAIGCAECLTLLNGSFLAELSDLDTGNYHACAWRYSLGNQCNCGQNWYLETVGSEVMLYCKPSSSEEAIPLIRWAPAGTPETPWRCDTVSGYVCDVPTGYAGNPCVIVGSKATVTAIP